MQTLIFLSFTQSLSMNDKSDNSKNISTPERKREYINRWLEETVRVNANLNLSCSEKTPPNSPHSVAVFKTQFLSPAKKNLFSNQTSPILSGKRPATSPIIGGNRKFSKRGRLIKKTSNKTVDNEIESSASNKLKNDQRPSFVPAKDLNTALSHASESYQCDQTVNCSSDFEKLSPFKKVVKSFTELFNDSEPTGSQVIESVSSDNKSVVNSEIIVQEIKSDTSKTVSDLIEDINCSQAVLEPYHAQNQEILSQNISNPTSKSSENINEFDSSNLVSGVENIHQQSTDVYTQVDQIESVSTLDSKLEFSKISYILQCSVDKTKKKKNPKKGSLLDTLVSTIGREKSSVNLLRHQIHKKTDNINEKPFILLQILEHLSVMNDSQLFKCVLIEDTANLLYGFVEKNSTQSITVINNPEISSIINVDHKPILKIYEPWTILDYNQLVMHITRFIAIPAIETKKCDEVSLDEYEIIHENYCSCIDKKVLSHDCQLKINNSNQNRLIKKIVDY